MQSAERVRRFGSWFALVSLAALAAFGCSEDELEVLEFPGEPVQVTTDTSTSFHRAPSLSPDGTTVIFSTDWRFNSVEKDARDIAVINLPLNGERYPFTASPELDSLAMFRKVEFPTNMISDGPGGVNSQFDPDLNSKADPVWDPVVTDRMAVSIQNRNRLDRIYLCTLDLSSTVAVSVTSHQLIGDPRGLEYYYLAPAFSPDGRWLLYSRFFFRAGASASDPPITEPMALYVVDLAAGPPYVEYQVTPGASKEGSGAWSPDGSMIVFESNRRNNGGSSRDLFTIEFDAADPTRMPLTDSIRRLTYSNLGEEGPSYLPEESYDPTWSPDGSSIVFVSTRRAPAVSFRDRSLWIMNNDGSDQRLFFFSRRDDVTPCFSLTNPRLVLFSTSQHVLAEFEGERADIWLLQRF